MTLALLRRLRRQLADERGAMALMTLVFLMCAGFVMIVFLWVIGYAGGAYNTIQGAAQTTAYAAVGAVMTTGGDQPRFDCGPVERADGLCLQGSTFNTAQKALAISLSTSKANWGLSYNPALPNPSNRVCFADPYGNCLTQPGVYAYNVAFPPGVARQIDPDCQGTASSVGLSGRSCWILMHAGVGEPQYVSGVAVYLTTVVELPGCVASWCPQQPITAVAAASQAQDETQPY